MDQSLLEQVTPYLVSGVVAIAALLLGRRLERRDTHQSWLRERRLEAYSEMLENCHDLWFHATDIWPDADQPNATEAQADAVDRVGECFFRGGILRARIRLLGPDPVVEAAQELGDSAERYSLLVGNLQRVRDARRQGLSARTVPEGAAFLDAETAFVETAQAVIR